MEKDKGGWGIIVVAGSHLVQALTVGVASSLGVFLNEWAYDFDISVGSASLVIAIIPLIVGLFSPFSAALIGKFGCRPIAFVGSSIAVAAVLLSSYGTSLIHLFLSFGVMLAIGTSMIYSSAILILGVYFEKRLVLANSLSFVGISSGQLVAPPVFRFLIDTFGWRSALFVLSAIFMHVFLSAAVFRPMKIPKPSIMNHQPLCKHEPENPSSIEERCTDGSDINPKTSIWRTLGIPALCINPHFMLTILAINNISMSLLATLIFIIPQAEAAGISKDYAALLITFIGVGGFIGRLGHGIAIDRSYISMPNIFMLGMISCTLEIVLMPVFNIYGVLVLLAFLFGVSNGIVSSLTMVIPREVMSSTPDLIRPALGLAMLVSAVGQFVGGLVAALLFNTTGTYGASYYVLGGWLGLTTLMYIPTYRTLHAKNGKRKRYNQQDQDVL